MATRTSKTVVLFLAANPGDTTALDLRREANTIQAALDPEAMTIAPRFATTWSRLIDALSETNPDIVHFSGHGTSQSEILLEKADGTSHPLDRGILAEVFGAKRRRIRLAVLNGCFTLPAAEAAVRYIDCAIGTQTAVSDDTAIQFARRLYFDLSRGCSVREALATARVELRGHGNPEHAILHYRYGEGVDPAAVVFGAPPAEPAENAALALWREKVGFLNSELALAEGAQKFTLLKRIQEAQEMIRKLEART